MEESHKDLSCVSRIDECIEILDSVLNLEDCRHWMRGDCLFGLRCRFAHRPKLKGSLHNIKSKKCRRQSIFRRWLILKHDQGLLDLTCTLDVCGGDGILSTELLNLNRKRCYQSTVIDCRIEKISRGLVKRIKAMNKGRYHTNPLSLGTFLDVSKTDLRNATDHLFIHDDSNNHNNNNDDDGCEKDLIAFSKYQCFYGSIKKKAKNKNDDGFVVPFAFEMPSYLRLYFDHSLFWKDSKDLSRLVDWQKAKLHGFVGGKDATAAATATAGVCCTSSLLVANDKKEEENSKTLLFESRVSDDCQSAKTAISESTCIIGLHCDDAAECIMDECFKMRKGFAIVPCCVFPNLHPERRFRDNGRSVRNYSDFIEYLIQKYSESECQKNSFMICKDEMGRLDGRNVVIYGYPL